MNPIPVGDRVHVGLGFLSVLQDLANGEVRGHNAGDLLEGEGLDEVHIESGFHRCHLELRGHLLQPIEYIGGNLIDCCLMLGLVLEVRPTALLGDR